MTNECLGDIYLLTVLPSHACPKSKNISNSHYHVNNKASFNQLCTFISLSLILRQGHSLISPIYKSCTILSRLQLHYCTVTTSQSASVHGQMRVKAHELFRYFGGYNFQGFGEKNWARRRLYGVRRNEFPFKRLERLGFFHFQAQRFKEGGNNYACQVI